MRTSTALAFALASALATTCPAAVIEVTTSSTAASLPDACTLRAAIVALTSANPVGGCPSGDPFVIGQPPPSNTILLPPGSVISFTDAWGDGTALPDIFLAGLVEIDGRGATIERFDQLADCAATPSATDNFRLIRVTAFAPDSRLAMRNLTLRNGCVGASSPDGFTVGGALFGTQNIAMSLALDNVRIVGSTARNGAALYFLGPVDLDIQRSYFAQNRANGPGGGVVYSADAGSRVRIARSTFAANNANASIVQLQGAAVELRDTTFSGNVGGAATASLGNAGAGREHRLFHNTFADNTVPTGVARLSLGGNVRWQANLMAETPGPNCGFAANALVAATGASFSFDGSCPQTTQIVPQLAQLRPLGEYGGPVPTRPPQTGALLIDAYSSCTDPDSGAPIGADARGVARPQDGDSVPGALCDVGAAEFVRNQAPTIALPAGPFATLPGQPLLVAPAIVLTDPDARDLPIELRLEPDDGVVDFDASALDCTTGDGNADPVAVCRASLARLNAALAGLSYTPRPGFTGADALRVEVNDLGAGGDDGTPRGDVQDLAIAVVATAPLAAIAGPIELGNVVVGTQSSAVAFAIANEGNATLVVQSPALPPGSPFRIEGSCPPLPPATTCQLQAFFTPAAAGPSATFASFTSNAANSPTLVTLQGNGIADANLILRDGFEGSD